MVSQDTISSPTKTCFSPDSYMFYLFIIFLAFLIPLQFEPNFHFCLLHGFYSFLPHLSGTSFHLFQNVLILLQTLTGHFLKSSWGQRIFKFPPSYKYLVLSFDHLESWMTGYVTENVFVSDNFSWTKNSRWVILLIS